MAKRHDTVSCKAFLLAESGRFEDWRSIQHHMDLTAQGQVGFGVFESAAMRYALDRCCEQARLARAR